MSDEPVAVPTVPEEEDDEDNPKSPIKGKYTVKTTKIETRPGTWNMLKCEVFCRREDGGEPDKVGEYQRNYSSFFNTFEPFLKDGKEYALISENYSRTAAISLPDCKIVAKEDPSAFGFCPTGFHVPWLGENIPINGHFGIICGCVWGDEFSWKVQFLDLSKIEEGIIRREARWGYVELEGGSATLAKCVKADAYRRKQEDPWELTVSILAWQERNFTNDSEEVKDLRIQVERLQKLLAEKAK
ncbi:hypothetical protein KBA73_01385 [Patescibacteria group bacterium]|nr:hypothetical protein [Patescibacteria group bacterium]